MTLGASVLEERGLSRKWSLPAVSTLGRIVCLIAILAVASLQRRDWSAALTHFDGSYYRYIALHGYPHGLPIVDGRAQRGPVAFFPLFPLLAGVVHAITHLPFVISALIINLPAAAAASTLVERAVRDIGPASRTTACLWTLQPMTFVFVMTYSEGLFCALAAGCLLLLLRERWVAAGLTALAAGATRPSGLVLAVCCLAAALIRCRRGWTPAPFVAVLLAPLGALGYFGYLWYQTGVSNAWFRTEREGWQVYFDGGIDNLHRVVQYTQDGRLDGLVCVAYVAAAAVLLVLLARLRPGAVVLAYAVGLFVLTVMTRNALSSAPRFLLPDFPLLVPLAGLFENRPVPLRVVLIASTVLMAAAGVYFTSAAHYPP